MTKSKTLAEKLKSRLQMGMRQRSVRLGLARSLTTACPPPQAKFPLSVRPFRPGDEAALFEGADALPPSEQAEIAWRREHLAAEIPTCYVGVDDRNDRPCYMQWLMGAKQNHAIQKHLWGFPILEPDEALLENAYTPPRYRGQGVMAAAMWLLGERGRDVGATRVLTFVGVDNIPSLKGCEKAGFFPRLEHHHERLFFGVWERHLFKALPQPAS